MAVNAFTPFANREVMDLIFVDYSSKKPILNWPLANATATSTTGEVVHAYGGQGHPKRVPFYGEKGGTLTLETQMQSYALYSIITGGTISNTVDFLEREEITATEDGTLPLAGTPIGDVSLFSADDDCGTPLAGVAFADATLTCDSVEANKKYVAYYIKNYSEGVTSIRISSDTFPKAVTIYGTTVSRTEDDQIVAQKMIAYKASAQMEAEWNFANNGDPASLSITFDLLVDEDDRLLEMLTIE